MNFDKQHKKNAVATSKQIEKAFHSVINQFAKIGNNPKAKFQRSFKFYNDPDIRKEADLLTLNFAKELEGITKKSVNTAWSLSNNKNDNLAKSYLKSEKLLKLANCSDHNKSALSSFINRQVDGLGLSDRVWNNAVDFKNEMEMHLGIGLMNGDSADVISRRARQYLNEPDKLFRRVRDNNGKLILSKNALLYNPGQGKYRSSYKNARRLAVTETNMAYRRSDHLRWNQMDFVVGYEIKLSAAHPVFDICDPGAGRYPKGFIFTGWHPHCFCYAVPIMLDDKDFDSYIDSLLGGNPFDPTKSKNFISGIPKSFADYLTSNPDRYKNYKNLPYFLTDNAKYLNDLKNLKVAKDVVVDTIAAFTPAKSLAEAERFGKTIADHANYKGVSLEVANDWNESIYYHVSRFPELKDNQKFIGTIQERNKYYVKAKTEFQIKNNTEAWQICLRHKNGDAKEARKFLETYIRNKDPNIKNTPSKVMAQAWKNDTAGGVSMNANYFKNLDNAKRSMEYDVKTGFHPQGCNTVKSVIDHEMGHQLDYLLGLRNNRKLVNLYYEGCEPLTDVSRYSGKNIAEFIAEAWSEYLNNPQPRDVSLKVGKIIENEYKKFKTKRSG